MKSRASYTVLVAFAFGCAADDPGVEPGSDEGPPTSSSLGTTTASSTVGSTDMSTGAETSTGAGTTLNADTSSDSSSTDAPPLFDLGIPPDIDGGKKPIDCTDTTAMALTTFVPCQAPIALVPPYDDDYECWQYVDVPGVPPEYGGMTFALDDHDLLLLGGEANTFAGALYSIRVSRDSACNVTGFIDASAAPFAAAEYNDGGIVYAGDGVMFLARWPVNELGQLLPGDTETTKVIDMTAAGVDSLDSGTAALAFVPGGFPGEGLFKLVTWSGGYWYTVDLSPDGMGTYDVASVTEEVIIPGGPEGFVFVGDESPEVLAPSVLVAEWSANRVSIYEIDAEGDPILATNALFIDGLDGPEGAHIDPLSGNFLFSTFGGGNVLVAIRGFTPNEPPPPPG